MGWCVSAGSSSVFHWPNFHSGSCRQLFTVPRAYAESIATSVRYACGYGSPADTNQSNVHCVALMVLIRTMNAVQKC